MTNSDWQGQWSDQPVPPQPSPQSQWQPQSAPGTAQPGIVPLLPGQPPAPGAGVLILDAKPVMLSGFLTSPGVTVHGYPLPAKWGENYYQVPPGQYQVNVKVNYIFPFGEGSIPVQVSAGQASKVYYAAPNGVFFQPALGYEPQQNPGLWLFWVALGAALLIILLMFVLIIVAVFA